VTPAESDDAKQERLTAEITGLDQLEERPVSVRFESGDRRSWQTRLAPGPDLLLCTFSRELIPPPADRGAVVVDMAQRGGEAALRLGVRLWGQSGQEWARLHQGPGGVVVTYGPGQSVRRLRYRFAVR